MDGLPPLRRRPRPQTGRVHPLRPREAHLTVDRAGEWVLIGEGLALALRKLGVPVPTVTHAVCALVRRFRRGGWCAPCALVGWVAWHFWRAIRAVEP